MTKIVDPSKELSPSKSVTEETARVVRAESDRRPRLRERADFGAAQQKLQVLNQDSQYHYHWINDYPGRVQYSIARGYDFVSPRDIELVPGVVPLNADLGDRVSMVVGSTEAGQPLVAYLMRIPMEFYNEDQSDIQADIDRREAGIRKGKTTGQETDSFYTPRNEKIKLERDR